MLLFADGFEHYGTGTTGRTNMLNSIYSQIDAAIGPDATVTRTGTLSLRVSNSPLSAACRLSLPSPKVTVGIGFGIYFPELPDRSYTSGVCFRAQNGTGLITFTVQQDGSFRVLKGGPSASDSDMIGVTDSVINAGTFVHVEIKLTIDDLVGEYEIRINGVTAAHSTTLNLGTVPCGIIEFNNGLSGNAGKLYYIDDFIIWDDNGDYSNDFLGPVRVLTLLPVSDTAQADWSIVGSVTGVGAITDIPPDGDTTYIQTATVGDKSDFTLPELPSQLAFISSVYVPALMRSDEAGISNVTISMISGSPDSIASGTDHPLTASYSYYGDVFDIDPATGVAWTKEGFENALLRIEKTL